MTLAGPLTMGRLFRMWAPMGATWFMMSMEGLLVAAIVARLPEATVNLAAYGVAFAFALMLEAPIIMVLSASTALCRDHDAFLRLRRYVTGLNVLLTTLTMLWVLTPLYPVSTAILTDVDRLLPRDDREASEVIREAFEAEGIEIVFGGKVRGFSWRDGGVTAEVETRDGVRSIRGDRLLVSTGRSPNVANLGLEEAGVRFDLRRGVPVDTSLRTNVPHIYACGDVTGPYRFTHTADYQARIVVRNILLPPPIPRARVDYRHVPWVTYVDPEVAHFGLREEDAEEQGIAVDVHQHPADDLDRAITESATRGFVKVVTARGKDRILGATVVASRGGEILHQIMAVARSGGGLGSISGMIHAYPTWAQAAQRVGDAYNRTRLTARARAIFEWLYRRRR